MYFSDLDIQNSSRDQLINLFHQARVPHAILLSGPPGCGHLQLALSFSALLLCESPKDNDACKSCSSCVKYEKLQHPDLHLSFPIHLSKTEHSETSDDRRDLFVSNLEKYKCISTKTWYSSMGNENKQGVIGVKESQSIIKKMNFKSFFGGPKILVMWLPELMNLQASNKLLKLIEEPAENTYFIMVSENKNKILPTIYSRLQNISIPKMELNVISNFMKKNFQVLEPESKIIANLSSGDLNKAVVYHLNSGTFGINLTLFIKWMRLCYTRNIADTIDWVNELSKMGREQIKDFINYTLEMSRQCIFGNFSIKRSEVSEEEENFLNKFQPFINHKNISEINTLMNDAYYHIERNANPKILMLDVSLQLYKLLRK